MAMKSYFDDPDESDVLVSVVEEAPLDEDPVDVVAEAGVTDGAMAEAGEPPGEPIDVAGEFEVGLAEDGPAVVGEFGTGLGDAELPGTFGADDVEG